MKLVPEVGLGPGAHLLGEAAVDLEREQAHLEVALLLQQRVLRRRRRATQQDSPGRLMVDGALRKAS